MTPKLECDGPPPTREELAGLETLEWRTPQATVLDLRDVPLARLSILDIGAPLRIVLPPSVQTLALTGDLTELVVDGAAAVGASVSLWGELGGAVPLWAEAAGELEISRCSRLDLAQVATMTDLRSLTLRDVSGQISGCECLAEATSLERIALYRCYEIDVAAFPSHGDLPNLQWFMASDISTAGAKTLRQRFDGFWNAHVRHPRSPAWLAQHRDDPFRTWGDWSPQVARKASALWRETASRLKAAASSADREDAIASFASALDELAAGHPLDTLQREQAGEAVRGLAALHLPTEHRLSRWHPL